MNLQNENKKLKKELLEAHKEIADLKVELLLIEENFDLLLFEALEKALHNYHSILNPRPTLLQCSYKGKSEEYEVWLRHVICFTSGGTGRTKRIYLREKITNLIGDNRKTNILLIQDGIAQVKQKIDPMAMTLVQVSKESVVNAGYYSLNGNTLVCVLKNVPESIKEIPISPKYKKNFIAVQRQLMSIVSLHKKLFRYKQRK